MTREVRHDADGPAVLTEEDVHPEKGDIAVCRCGLSPEFPFCDGSHRATLDEDGDTRYCYPGGPGGERRIVTDLQTADEGGAAVEPTGWATEDDDSGDEASVIAPDALPGVPGGEAGGSRLVTHDAHGPTILEPEDLAASGGERRVCRCGLSDDRPFCDGSHAVTASESPGVVYRYEADGEARRTIVALAVTDETDD